jgi:hypothetical protein
VAAVEVETAQLRAVLQDMIESGKIELNGQRPVIVSPDPEFRTLIRPRVHAVRRGVSCLYCEVLSELCEVGWQLRESGKHLRESFGWQHVRWAFRMDDL